MTALVSYLNTGEIRIYALYCGGDLMDMAVFDPFDPKVGTKYFNPYYAYVITHPSGNVLFDTGAHPALRNDAASRLGSAAASFEVIMGESDWICPRLNSIGLSPADISHVVQSHLHFDHSGGLEWFKHAKIYLQRRELEFARRPPVYQKAAFVPADFEHGLCWELLDGAYDVFDDGILKIIPTPGHTPGHQSLLVGLKSQPVFLLGDAAYLVSKMRQRALPGLIWNPDAIIDTWDRIEEIERQLGVQLVATHELDFKESVPVAPGAWFA